MTTESRILRAKQVAERLGVTTATVWNKSNPKGRRYDPAFPRPFRVSENVTGWLESEISEYIKHLAAQRGANGKEQQA